MRDIPTVPKVKDEEEAKPININKTMYVEDELLKRNIELKQMADEEAKRDLNF